MVRLLSISAPAGGGKDYLADYLVENHGFVKMRFAQPLYEAVSVITGLTPAEVEAVKEGKFSVVRHSLLPSDNWPVLKDNMRKILQMVGTEIGRDLWNQNNWVNHLGRRIDGVLAHGRQGYGSPQDGEPYNGIVVTDTRFPNEFDMLEARGFFMLDLQAPDEFLRIRRDDPKWEHPSERALDWYRATHRFHQTVVNDRTETAKEMLSRALPWF